MHSVVLIKIFIVLVFKVTVDVPSRKNNIQKQPLEGIGNDVNGNSVIIDIINEEFPQSSQHYEDKTLAKRDTEFDFPPTSFSRPPVRIPNH